MSDGTLVQLLLDYSSIMAGAVKSMATRLVGRIARLGVAW